jgi:hypothetical protein
MKNTAINISVLTLFLLVGGFSLFSAFQIPPSLDTSTEVSYLQSSSNAGFSYTNTSLRIKQQVEKVKEIIPFLEIIEEVELDERDEKSTTSSFPYGPYHVACLLAGWAVPEVLAAGRNGSANTGINPGQYFSRYLLFGVFRL